MVVGTIIARIYRAAWLRPKLMRICPLNRSIGKSDASIKQDEKLPIQDESDSASKTHTAYGPVKQGDTLVRIAKNIVLPAGASLNQMLVALHRANRDAFFGNNMNQLKTGPILRIPDNE